MNGYYRYDKNNKITKREILYTTKETIKDILQYPFADWHDAGIRKETMEYLGCRVKFTQTAPQEIAAVYFPAYSKYGKKITGY